MRAVKTKPGSIIKNAFMVNSLNEQSMFFVLIVLHLIILVYLFALVCISNPLIGQCFINGVCVCVCICTKILNDTQSAGIWSTICPAEQHGPVTTFLLCSCSGSVEHDDTLHSWPPPHPHIQTSSPKSGDHSTWITPKNINSSVSEAH